MKFDEKNIILDNVLEQEEISEIYKSLEKSYKKYIMDLHVQQISDFRMPVNTEKKIISYVESITGLSGFEMEYQFSRYELLDFNGKTEIPNLRPHFDRFSEPRFTFDYQVNSNISWPLYVEGKEFVLKNNQALTFSGTHQIHWRPNREFVPGEFIEMVFCHLYLKDTEESLGPDHFNMMDEKAEEWRLRLENSNG
jgi:hypothetical protein